MASKPSPIAAADIQMLLALRSNVLSTDLTATVLKIWQRLCACLASLETHERIKSHNIDKKAYCLEAYKRYAEEIVITFKGLIPVELTAERLCCESFNSSNKLTGKQIWETIWDDTQKNISNIFFPIFWKTFPQGIPSGKQIDDVALEFRKKLFDNEKNKLFLLPSSSTPSASSCIVTIIAESSILPQLEDEESETGIVVVFTRQ
jgi:hypothetical protein